MSGNILVIGGNSGIGLELIKKLNKSGYNLTVASRSNSNLSEFDNLEYREFDASDSNFEMPSIPEQLKGLVYLPGTINLKPFNRIKEKDFEDDWRINFLGAVKVIQHALPSLKKGTNPSIVLISTVAVQSGLAFHTSISAAKGAIEGFVRALAAELAPTIRVNAIAPSLTDTPLAERLLNSESKVDSSSDRHPLKRVGRPVDQANAISYLLSDESSWITGQILHVDGGLSVIR